MILFTCGGTGGHISPALALAQCLNEPYHFVGGDRMEKQMLSKEPFTAITTSPKNPFKIFLGLLQSLRMLSKLKPRLIFATGGYVTVPVCLAGLILGIPLYLLEQNSIPGKTNRFLGHFARRIYCGYPGLESYFPAKKLIFSGNPVIPLPSPQTNTTKPLILIMGGSQGASRLNQMIMATLPLIDMNIDLHWVVGPKHFKPIQNQLLHTFTEAAVIHSDETELKIKQKEKMITVVAFEKNVPQLLTKATLAISRSGAMSVAELTEAGIPAIYIPFPYATDNHQFYNAKFVTEKGAGILLLESELSPTILKDNLMKLLNSLENYKQSCRQLPTLGATKTILGNLPAVGQLS